MVASKGLTFILSFVEISQMAYNLKCGLRRWHQDAIDLVYPYESERNYKFNTHEFCVAVSTQLHAPANLFPKR